MGCCCPGSSKPAEASRADRNPLLSRANVCCTDIVFLILFCAFWGLLIYIAVFAVMQGDAKRLYYGYDSFGNTCNENNTEEIANLTNSGASVEGLKYVFFMSVFDPFDAMQVCVKSCPDKDLTTPQDVKDFAERTGSKLCSYEVPLKDYTNENLYKKQGPCPQLPVYKSIKLLHRCAPDPAALLGKPVDMVKVNATKKFKEIFEVDDFFKKVLNDLYLGWKEILALFGIAVVIAFLMVLLMRFFAAIIVWTIVVLAVVGSLVGTGFLWWTYVKYKKLNDSSLLDIPVVSFSVKNETAFLWFSIIASVLTVILLLILLVMRKRISLVVALFNEAGKAVIAMPLLFIQPLWTFLILLIFFVYWAVIMGYVVTIGTPKANYDKGFTRVEYVQEGFPKQFWWIHLIGLIWTAEFILACQQFVIAGSVTVWYFTRVKSQLVCPVCGAVNILIQHHLGSMAFGSLVITIVKIPRYILMYIQQKCEGSQNKCAQCCLKCCICGLWCLEKCLKFLNQNAYTIIAIEGSNLCSAGQKAFSIIASNLLRVTAINTVGDFVLFLGKVGVMAASCACAVLWLRTLDFLYYYAIPVFIVTVFSYIIAHCFLSVYEMVVDALLLCFCEDTQMNDGSEGREYFMSTSLMAFVKDSSAKIDALNKRKAREKAVTEERTELQQKGAGV